MQNCILGVIFSSASGASQFVHIHRRRVYLDTPPHEPMQLQMLLKYSWQHIGVTWWLTGVNILTCLRLA